MPLLPGLCFCICLCHCHCLCLSNCLSIGLGFSGQSGALPQPVIVGFFCLFENLYLSICICVFVHVCICIWARLARQPVAAVMPFLLLWPLAGRRWPHHRRERRTLPFAHLMTFLRLHQSPARSHASASLVCFCAFTATLICLPLKTLISCSINLSLKSKTLQTGADGKDYVIWLLSNTCGSSIKCFVLIASLSLCRSLYLQQF